MSKAAAVATPHPVQTLVQVPIAHIVAGALQSRTVFNEEKLKELAASICEKGILEPLLLRRVAKAFTVEPGKQNGKPGSFLIDWRKKGTCPIGLDSAGNEYRRDENADVVQTFFKTQEEAQAAMPHFEIVAGERRFRAAQIAKLTEVPAIVRDLSDEDAFDIALIENIQREDLNVFEQAEAYRTAITDGRYGDVDSLAKRLGKSRSAVYSVIKLNNVPDEIRPRILSGEISASVGELIARLPNADTRARFAAKVEKGTEQWDRTQRKTVIVPLTLRAAKEVQIDQFMIELKGAVFSREDASLVPEAGACTVCPKRAGNNPELFPDARADMCTDPACYRKKRTAHEKAATERGQAAGLTMVKGKGVFSKNGWNSDEGSVLTSSGYLDLNRPLGNEAKSLTKPQAKQTLKQLLGVKVETEAGRVIGASGIEVYGAVDHKGHLRKLVKRADVKKLLVAAGIALREPEKHEPGFDPKAHAAEQLKEENAKKIREAAATKALELVAAYKWKLDVEALRMSLLGARIQGNKAVAAVKAASTLDQLARVAMIDMAEDGLRSWIGNYYDHMNARPRMLAILKTAGVDLEALHKTAAAEFEAPAKKRDTEGACAKEAECVSWLTTSGDVNFKTHLLHASIEILEKARRVRKLTKTSKQAIESRLRKLVKEAKKK